MASARTSLKLVGGEELLALFRDLPKRVQTRSLTRAILAGAKMVREEVLRRVPVDTGALKRGIKVRAGKRRRNQIHRHVFLPERQALGIDAKDPGYYPAAIEYGSTNRGLPANPFLRGSFAAKQNEVLGLVRDALRQELTSARAAQASGA